MTEIISKILEKGNNVEITGLDENKKFLGVLYAYIDEVRKLNETVVVQCTDVSGRKHTVIVQESDSGELSNLVQAWGTNTPFTRVYGPVPRARVSIWNRRSK